MTGFSRWTRMGLCWVALIVMWLALVPVEGWTQAPVGPSSLEATPDGEHVPINLPGPAGRATPVSAEAPIQTDLWSIIQKGGVLMIPIALCSFILMAFIFERMIALRKGRVIPRPFVTRFLSQLREGELDREDALHRCERNGSPVAEVFAGAVRKWGRPAVEVEQAIIDSGERATNNLRRYLRVFNGIATISPLLGLLGTVVGMINAFNDIATSDAMGRPEKLADGISTALLTTAAGLTVAIPALIFYLFFVSRVDRLIIDIDALGLELVPLISAEEMQTQSKTTKRPAAKSRRTTKKGSVG